MKAAAVTKTPASPTEGPTPASSVAGAEPSYAQTDCN